MRDPRSQPAENACLYLDGEKFVVQRVDDYVFIDDGMRCVPFTLNRYITAFKRAITSIKEL